MITIILLDKQCGKEIATYWEAGAERAWITDSDASPLLRGFGEKHRGVVDLKPSPVLGDMQIADVQSFAAALREYALTRTASPVWIAHAFVLKASDQELTLSLVKASGTRALAQLASPIRDTVNFVTDFFLGVPQTAQDRLIYTRLPDFGIPF